MNSKLILIPLLGCLAAACHKEGTVLPNTQHVYTDIQVHYLIDGEPHIAHLQDSSQRHLLIADLIALTHQGHHLRLLASRPSATSCATKETKTLETDNLDEAAKWAQEMSDLGYSVNITYDEKRNLYILTATK
ncbi:MAG: hypothetical protein IJ785_06495 [Bacteroidales bacterium]|nr:hypothetical protein [Bacteroidales bacterium]